MPCASACVMYSGLRPSIEIISTGAAWAPNTKKATKTTKKSGETKKRQTKRRAKCRWTAFMRSTPLDILMGTGEAVRTLKLNSQAIGDGDCEEVYSVQCTTGSGQRPFVRARKGRSRQRPICELRTTNCELFSHAGEGEPSGKPPVPVPRPSGFRTCCGWPPSESPGPANADRIAG